MKQKIFKFCLIIVMFFVLVGFLRVKAEDDEEIIDESIFTEIEGEIEEEEEPELMEGDIVNEEIEFEEEIIPEPEPEPEPTDGNEDDDENTEDGEGNGDDEDDEDDNVVDYVDVPFYDNDDTVTHDFNIVESTQQFDEDDLLSGGFDENLVVNEEKQFFNGQLRCPTNLSAQDKGKCVEFLNNENIVTRVEVTEKFGDYTVVKKVTKVKDRNDQFSISFNVKGPGTGLNINDNDAYIVVLFDKSYSLTHPNNGKYYKAAYNAAIAFSERFKKYHIALVVFANEINQDSNFHSSKFAQGRFTNDIGTRSRIDKGFKAARELFNKVPEGKSMYLVVFGDGKYWHDNDCCRSSIVCKDWLCGRFDKNCSMKKDPNNANKGLYFERQIALLKNFSMGGKKIKIYAMLYKSNSSGSKNIQKDYEWMAKIHANGGGFYDFRTTNDYNSAFNQVANAIETDYTANMAKIAGKLTDHIGSKFTMVGSSKTTQDYSISVLNNGAGVNLGPFTIQIDHKANGWNATNSKYDTTFYISSTQNLNYSSIISPEVYWENTDTTRAYYCSDSATKDVYGDVKNSYYYKVTCDQGWPLSATNKVPGFNATIVINGNDKKSGFYLPYGSGFPIGLQVINNVRCKYELTKSGDKYIIANDIASYITQKNNTTVAKNKAAFQAKIDEATRILNNYNTLTTGSELRIYADNFMKEKAKIRIDYSDSIYNIQTSSFEDNDSEGYKNSDVITLVDGSHQSSLNCSGGTTVKINGVNYVDGKTCVLHVEKVMSLDNMCVSMSTGQQVPCDSSSDEQLKGTNEYHPSLYFRKGAISASMENADYFGNNFELYKRTNDKNEVVDACQFIIQGKEDLLYRNIEISDPFLEKYTNNQRGIGSNFKNNQYDFTKIAKSKVWDSPDYEYRFLLSPQNVANFQAEINLSDESEDRNSYLGTDCHITFDKKYKCNFLRSNDPESSEDGNNQYFTKVYINE